MRMKDKVAIVTGAASGRGNDDLYSAQLRYGQIRIFATGMKNRPD